MELKYHENSRVILWVESVCWVLMLCLEITKVTFPMFARLWIYLNWPFFSFLITLNDTEVWAYFYEVSHTEWKQDIYIILYISYIIYILYILYIIILYYYIYYIIYYIYILYCIYIFFIWRLVLIFFLWFYEKFVADK